MKITIVIAVAIFIIVSSLGFLLLEKKKQKEQGLIILQQIEQNDYSGVYPGFIYPRYAQNIPSGEAPLGTIMEARGASVRDSINKAHEHWLIRILP